MGATGPATSSESHRRDLRPGHQYLLAVGAVLVAVLVRLPFEPWLHGRAPYSLYFPAIVIVAWWTGVRPTLLASALALVAAWYFSVPPVNSFALPDSSYRASLVIFGLTAGALIWMSRVAAANREQMELAWRTARRAQEAANATAWNNPIAGPAIDAGQLERLLGLQAGAEILAADRPALARAIEQALAARGRFQADFQVRGPGALQRWMIGVGEVTGDGGPRLVGLTLDASDRRRADRSQASLAAIVQSSSDAIIGIDLDGTVRSWNAAGERMYGYTEPEIIGRPVWQLVPPERHDEEEGILARLRRGERIEHYETVRVARDGRRLEVSLSISPIRDQDGQIIGASKIARDISERKRADRALAEQREWQRVTLSSIGDAVITTDRQGNVTFVNRVAEVLTGFAADQARGRPLGEVFKIINEDTRQPADNPCDKVLRTGATVALANHTSLIARDGSECPIEDSAAPIVDDDRNIMGVVLVFHDVTERRQAERERQKAERERELLLQSERAARGEAERATRMKDDFVATVSHELRTPLNAILGWTQVLQRKPPSPENLSRGLGIIERNTRLQAQLIDDLLDMSRIVSGKLKLELQLVDLPAVIDTALESVRLAAQAKNIQLGREVDERIAPVAGDATRLQQVVSNLLTNAIKFTPMGGQVAVKLEHGGSHSMISVTDSGIGIAPDFLPHLFDRFRQADSSITRRHGGLGLGLTIVKQLVELHGGSVSAFSAGEGHGASFVVRLPAGLSRPRSAPDSDHPDPSGAGAASHAIQMRDVKVLVVEDEPDTRELVQRLLSEAGCQVIAVESAAAAYDAIATDRPDQRPDIIVSDIGLPDEDGYSLIRRVRARSRSEGGAIPAIALTAFARSEDRTRAMHAGFQVHVSKPVEPAELVAVVASFAGMVQTDGGERGS